MPCGVTTLGVWAMAVALPPMVQGEQLACVTVKVKMSELFKLATGNVPLKAESLDPAMTTLERGTKLALFASVTVATLLATLMVVMGNGAPGGSIVGATPAPGIERPCPTRKSLTPPEQVIWLLAAVVLQVIVGGVKPL